MIKCPMCGGEKWEKGSIEVGELSERYVRFFSESKNESSIIGQLHGMVCTNCGFVLTFINQNNIPNKEV